MAAIQIINGQDKDLVVRLKNKGTGDPYDLNGIDLIQVCFKLDADATLKKYYLPFTGDTVNTSDLISAIPEIADIVEGQEISGPGIPAGATVLKTPTSTAAPTAAGVIQISANATATATQAALVMGDITIVGDPLLGKFNVPLSEADTEGLVNADFEVKLVKAGVTSYVVFKNALSIVKRIC